MPRYLITLSAIFIATFPIQLPAQGSRTAIHETAEQVQPLLPGMKAPSFTVRNVKGNPVEGDPAKREKPLVLTFFRGGWCPYCNLLLAEMRHTEADLTALGFDIWFISIDKPELLYPSMDQPDIAYTVLSDASLDATRAFGLAFRVDDETYDRYVGYGINLEQASGEKHHLLAQSGCDADTRCRGYSRYNPLGDLAAGLCESSETPRPCFPDAGIPPRGYCNTAPRLRDR